MIDPEFLDFGAVEGIHDLLLARFGGLAGVRDQNLLLSALARAENRLVYAGDDVVDLFDLAAAYAYGVAKNHPFNDANKRTALGCALMFLSINGAAVRPDADGAVETMVKLAAGEIGEAEFAMWLRSIAR